MKHPMIKILTTLALASGVALATTATSLADEKTKPVIMKPDEAKWIAMIPEMGTKGPTFSIVFGEPGVIGKPFGGMFRVPAGGESPAHIHTSEYWAVMVSGTESAREKMEETPMNIPAGSTWFQPAKAPHVNKCMGPEDCVFFVYYPNGMDYIPADAHK